MHYYQHNIGDYRRVTGHLTLLEHGICRSLIDTYYLTEKPLESDIPKLMRAHSIRTVEEKEALNNVLDDFFELTDKGYVNQECERIIAAFHQKREKARKSAEARWGKRTQSDRNANASKGNANASKTDANAMRKPCESDANHKPITNNQQPVSKKQTCKRSVLPVANEVLNYMIERGMSEYQACTESERFTDHYTANGWKVGRNAMKDWKAAVRNWMKRTNHNGSTQRASRGSAKADDPDDIGWLYDNPNGFDQLSPGSQGGESAIQPAQGNTYSLEAGDFKREP